MSKLDALKAQREELDKKIRDLASKQAAADRKQKDRQKIIIGAWVMEQRPALVQEIIANLTRPQDKAAFAGFTAPKIEAVKTAPTPTPAPNAPAPKLQAAGG